MATHVTIFGGSFNPIHLGHLALCKTLLHQGLTDEVWLMVSPANPLKHSHLLLPEQVRLHLCERAIEGESGIVASPFEFAMPRPSYTWQTLKALHIAYPHMEFSLLIGADNWAIFDRWAHHAEILAHHDLFIYPRPSHPLDLATLPACCHPIEAPLLPISSTEIRQRLQGGLDVSHMLPPGVEAEIRRLHLWPPVHP